MAIADQQQQLINSPQGTVMVIGGLTLISGGDGSTYTPTSFKKKFGYDPTGASAGGSTSTGGSTSGSTSDWMNTPALELNDPAHPYNQQAVQPPPGVPMLGSPGGSTNQPTATTQPGGGTTSSQPGDINLNPGYGYDLIQMEQAGNEEIARLQAQYARQLAEINNQAAMDRLKIEADLQRELQSNQISSTEYLAEIQLAQRESEFARSLAQQQLEFKFNSDLQLVQEQRQERLLQAQLSASPADWVAYQYYMRSLGTPEAIETADAIDMAGLTGEQGQPNVTLPGSLDSEGNPTGNLLGEQYEPPAPGYSDSSIQTLVDSLFTDRPGQYNPALQGRGAFNTQIRRPNNVSRAQAASFNDTDIQMLTSLLRGGIDVGGGRRVGINPQDYFQQVQDSWVPTLGEALNSGSATQYV